MDLPRFYPILDTAILERASVSAEEAAGAVLEGGTRILQFRHKADFTRSVFESAARVAELCREAGALFVMNDRVDMAMLLGSGVHVGQEDLPPAEARKLMSDAAIIGLSTHNDAQIRESAAEPVDYIAIGPLFATASKRNPDPVLGAGEFHRLRALSTRPVVAIGGITRERALEARAAGADSLAVIGDLFPRELTKASLRARTEEWIQLLKA